MEPYRFCSEAEVKRRQEQLDVHFFEASDGEPTSIVAAGAAEPCSTL